MEEVFVLTKKQTLLLLDASSLIFRAFFAVPPLSTKDGKPSNAVLGMARMMIAILRTPRDFMAACLDRPEPTFRHVMYKEYKAHRPAIADSLVEQLAPIYEMLGAFGIHCYEKAGYEADDLIATLCAHAEEKNLETHVITGDMDVLQVVSKDTTVFMPAKGGPAAFTKYDEAQVMTRFGVSPAQIVDYKSLVGDSSDNIKGVPGIGPKTAAQLLSQYGTLEALFKRCDALPEKVRAKLLPHEERAFVNRKLVTLCDALDVDINEGDLRYQGMNKSALRSFFEKYELHSLMRQMADGENSGHFPARVEEKSSTRQETKNPEPENESGQLQLL